MDSLKTVYRGMRIHGTEDARSILNQGMSYYWKDSEHAINDIFRVLEKFHKIKKLGNTPILRNHVLEASRSRRLQIWGTQSKDNANSYARHSPELIFLVLCDIGLLRSQINSYLNERYGEPHIVTFTVEEPDDGFCRINEVYGRVVPPENIQCIEKIDLTQPDPHIAMLRGEKVITTYQEIVIRN